MKSGRIFVALLLFAIAACLFPSRTQHAARAPIVPESSVIDVSADSDLTQGWTGASEGESADAGPLWWSARTLAFAGLLSFGIFILSQHLYFVAQNWRLRAVVEERAHLAHEIHDTVAQGFAGIGFQLQAIRNSMPPNSSALERQVDLAMELAHVSHEEVRRCISGLCPQALPHLGLLPALRACAERMIGGRSVNVETHCEDGVAALPPRVEDTLFRIGQEAIANSIRHAGAGTIRIRVQKHRNCICLSVEDDGTGFATDYPGNGFGLLGMRNRAESISAKLVVRSAPGTGTRVEVMAPLNSRFDRKILYCRHV